jgi:hypothetical protein
MVFLLCLVLGLVGAIKILCGVNDSPFVSFIILMQPGWYNAEFGDFVTM